MLVLGLILVIVAALAVVAALVGGSGQAVDLDLGPVGLDLTPSVIFLAGAATVLIFVMGLQLIRSGARRARKQRKDSKELTKLTEKLEAHQAEQRQGADADLPAERRTDTRADVTVDDTNADTRAERAPDDRV